MRLVVLAGLLLPQLAVAQFSKKFEAGSYRLTTTPGESLPGKLSLRNYDKLLVKTPQGPTRRLTPSQVSSFQIGNREYVTFTTVYPYHPKPAENDDKAAFVEQLASGRVVLVRYDRIGNTGIDWFFLYRYHDQCYFLTNRKSPIDNQRYNRTARLGVVLSGYSDSTVTILNSSYMPAELAYFKRAVKPFLAPRPDLLGMLEGGQIMLEQLPAALYALNNNLPYLPPAPRPNATSK